MFCDLVGFNSSTVEDAMELVSTMNAVYSCFDSLMDTFNVYKVSTICFIKLNFTLKFYTIAAYLKQKYLFFEKKSCKPCK